jgi:hypothetical protein
MSRSGAPVSFETTRDYPTWREFIWKLTRTRYEGVGILPHGYPDCDRRLPEVSLVWLFGPVGARRARSGRAVVSTAAPCSAPSVRAVQRHRDGSGKVALLQIYLSTAALIPPGWPLLIC